MKAAIIFKSLTGNTELIARTIREFLKADVIYYGEPKEQPDADFYFVGSWTDKGMCCEEISEFLKNTENKKIAYFGTAGFGGSPEYYHALSERVKGIVPASNEMRECFFCQGKMPMSIRERYASMLTEHPDDKKLKISIENFDEAIGHPSSNDLEDAKAWAERVYTN